MQILHWGSEMSLPLGVIPSISSGEAAILESIVRKTRSCFAYFDQIGHIICMKCTLCVFYTR